jgi:hypothetical protein
MSQNNIECPICYDEIDVLKNCVTTECGHKFHCNCLMKNSAQNGFSCPMCRSVMAEEPENSDDEDEELSEYEDFEEDEAFDDNVLTSFRMFHQQLAGEEVEEEPLQEEDEQPLIEEPEIVRPSAATIAARLVAQGFTMEDMVKCLLIDHEEYETESETNERLSDRMFGKFRQIISNYPREQREAQVQAEAERHQSIRLRLGPREEVEDSFARGSIETAFAQLQNRYQLLENDDLEEV